MKRKMWILMMAVLALAGCDADVSAWSGPALQLLPWLAAILLTVLTWLAMKLLQKLGIDIKEKQVRIVLRKVVGAVEEYAERYLKEKGTALTSEEKRDKATKAIRDELPKLSLTEIDIELDATLARTPGAGATSMSVTDDALNGRH